MELNRTEYKSWSAFQCGLEVGADLAGTFVKKKSELVDKTASLNDGNSSLEMSNHSATEKALVLDISNVAEIGGKGLHFC